MARGGELIQLLNGRGNLLANKQKLALSMPSQNDFDAKLYGDMAGDITPQGKGGNLLKGILEGISDVKGKAAVEERNAQMQKSMESIQKLEKLYEETSTKLQKAQNEELAMEAMLPALNGAVQAMPRLDPVARKELVTNILDQWNAKTGNSITLVSQDATDPMLVTLKDNTTGQTTTNSLTALFPGSPGLAENMAQMQPAMVEKRQMERDYLSIAQQAEARQQHAEAREQSKYDQEQKIAQQTAESGERPIAALTPGERNIYANTFKEIEDVAKESKAGMRFLTDLEDLYNKSDIDLSDPFNRNVPDMARISEKKRNYIKQSEKLNSQLSQSQIRGLGGKVTDAQRAIIERGLPTYDLPKEARTAAIETKKREFGINVLRGEYFANQIGKGLAPTEQGFQKYLKESGALDKFDHSEKPTASQNNPDLQALEAEAKRRGLM